MTMEPNSTSERVLAAEPPAPPELAPPAAPSGGYGAAAARGSTLALASQCIRLVFQIASLAVLARFLTPEDFGLVASVTAVVGVADILRDFGLSSAAVQAKSLTDGERTNLFWVNVALGTACAVVICACAPLIESLYHRPALGPITYSLALVFVINSATTQFTTELSRSLKFKSIFIAEASGYVGSNIIAIVMAVMGAGYWAIVVQQISAVLIDMIINIMATRWRPGWPQRTVSIKRFFRFGAGVLGTQLIAYTTMNIDNIALGVAKGPYVLGVYSRAYQLLMMPLNQINRPLTRVALPVLSRVQDDQELFERYLRKAQVVGCYVTATIFALTTALSEPIVNILFGSQWTDVVPVLSILAAGGVFRAVSQISYWAFLARAKTGAQFRLYLYTRPFMIAMILAGLPWGAIGVAIGSSTAYTIYWVISLVAVGRAVDIDGKRLLWNATRVLLFVSLPCGLLAYLGVLFVSESALQITVGTLLAAVYIFLASRIVPFIRSDLGTLWEFGTRALRRRTTGLTPNVRGANG